jgi:hypothetical protein
MSETMPVQSEQPPVDLDTLKAEGQQQAEAALVEIEGLDQMDYREKYAVVLELLNSMNNQENRFAVPYIAAVLKTIELEEESGQNSTELEKIRSYYNIAA